LKFCGQEALLVGGQALAVWAQFFVVEPTGELADKVTLDVDFVGSRTVANALTAALRWRLYVPSVEDSTPQTAKVSLTLPDGGIKQIDFLKSIAGLDTASIEARAVDLVLANGAHIRVLHPLDVLESRLRNLDLLPSKQNPVGRAQMKLAVGLPSSRTFRVSALKGLFSRRQCRAIQSPMLPDQARRAALRSPRRISSMCLPWLQALTERRDRATSRHQIAGVDIGADPPTRSHAGERRSYRLSRQHFSVNCTSVSA
jgi:hypothetical protein